MSSVHNSPVIVGGALGAIECYISDVRAAQSRLTGPYGNVVLSRGLDGQSLRSGATVVARREQDERLLQE